MLDAWRTMIIWGCGLGYYYFVDPLSDFGEPWTPYSFLQLAGFLVLIFGQLVYGGLLQLPFLFSYPVSSEGAETKDELIVEEFIGPASSLNLLSPISIKGSLQSSLQPSLMNSPANVSFRVSCNDRQSIVGINEKGLKSSGVETVYTKLYEDGKNNTNRIMIRNSEKAALSPCAGA